jgi:hypothetical protein
VRANVHAAPERQEAGDDMNDDLSERRAAVTALPLRQHARIEAARPGDVLTCASVGPAGEVIAVWSAAAGTARVTVHAPAITSVTSLSELSLEVTAAQPLPGGRVLLATNRCGRRAGGPDRNAIIYGRDGRVQAAETVGDGVAHLLADGAGHVWAGYFDEGIYGDYGRPGDPPPLAVSGLTRFSPELAPVWDYPVTDNPYGDISDCYALNVDQDTAWTCYYSGSSFSDFPLVRIRDGALAGWHNPLTGVRALAVSGSRVVLYGGYRPARDRLTAGVLTEGVFQPNAEYRLVLPDGAALPAPAEVIGRGPVLHVLAGDTWYQLAVSDVPAGQASRPSP